MNGNCMDLAALWLSVGGTELPLAMLLVFVAAKLMAELFQRLGLPAMTGEILAGVALGPSFLGWVSRTGVLNVISEIGMIFFLFHLGLGVKRSQLTRVGFSAGATAALAAVLPFCAGWCVLRWWGRPTIEALVVATALMASSVGITGQFLSSQGLGKLPSSRLILAAAVIDDVAGLVVLAFVSGLRDKLNLTEITLTSLLGIGFLAILARWGAAGAKKVIPRVKERVKLAEAEFALAMVLLFGLAVVAVYAGIAAVIGAFLAGIVLSESVERQVHTFSLGVSELFAPFFLAGVGLQFSVAEFTRPTTLTLTAAVIGAAILSKFAGGAVGAYRLGLRDALRCGCGLVPRGAIAIVAASVAAFKALISAEIYSVLVAMVLVTSAAAPILLWACHRDILHGTQPDGDYLRLG